MQRQWQIHARRVYVRHQTLASCWCKSNGKNNGEFFSPRLFAVTGSSWNGNRKYLFIIPSRPQNEISPERSELFKSKKLSLIVPLHFDGSHLLISLCRVVVHLLDKHSTLNSSQSVSRDVTKGIGKFVFLSAFVLSELAHAVAPTAVNIKRKLHSAF